MKAIKWGLCLVLLAVAGPAAAVEVVEGPVSICVTRNAKPQTGAAVTYLGAPAGIVQDALGSDGCATVDPAQGPYVWAVDAITTPVPPLRGDLKVCLARSAVAEVAKPVYVIVPPNTTPLVAVTDDSGCASFASFSGLYALFTTNLPLPTTPPEAQARPTR